MSYFTLSKYPYCAVCRTYCPYITLKYSNIPYFVDINPIVFNAPFLYTVKTSESLKVF